MAYTFQSARSGTAGAPVADAVATRYEALNGWFRMTSGWQVGGIYSRSHTRDDTTARSRLWSLGTTVDVTPLDRLAVGFARRDVSGTEGSRMALTVGLDHALSKGTSLYARLLAARDRDGVPSPDPLEGDGAGPVGRTVALGIKHNF